MDGSSLRTRCRLSGGLLLPLLGAALVSCGNGPAASTDSPDASFEGTTTCTQQVTPDDQSFVVSSSSDRGIPTVFSLKASRRDGYNDLSQTVDEGGQRLVTVQSHQSASRTELTIEFGGPSGNEQRVTATNDGKSMLMSINGRVLSPFTVGSDPKSLHFADGAAMDSVTPVDPQMLQTLGHIHEQAAAVIPTCGQTAAGGHLVQVLPTKTDDVEADACKFACGAFGSSCGCCSSCCEVAYAGCAGAALLGESQCVALAIAAAVATGGAAAVPSAGAIEMCIRDSHLLALCSLCGRRARIRRPLVGRDVTRDSARRGERRAQLVPPSPGQKLQGTSTRLSRQRGARLQLTVPVRHEGRDSAWALPCASASDCGRCV